MLIPYLCEISLWITVELLKGSSTEVLYIKESSLRDVFLHLGACVTFLLPNVV